MFDERGVWTEFFRVYSYEVDERGQAPIQTMCNYLQETAGNHARALGFSAESMHARGLAWVLARLDVEVDREPTWGHTISVETWHSGVHGLYTTREFVLRDDAGCQIGRAASSWIIINLERRRVTRPPKDLLAVKTSPRGRTLPDTFSSPPDDTLPQASSSPSGDLHRVITVRESDLDLNRHVNNARYAAWAVEALPLGLRTSSRLTKLELRFCAESTRGDTISTDARPDPAFTSGDGALTTDFVHRLARVGDDQALALARTHWTPRDTTSNSFPVLGDAAVSTPKTAD
jgi:acyl-ACP thioesterase